MRQRGELRELLLFSSEVSSSEVAGSRAVWRSAVVMVDFIEWRWIT